MAQFNSLNDWVAVKDDLFKSSPQMIDASKVKFLIAYNEIEKKFAITLHHGQRKASDIQSKSMAKSLSFQDLKNIHNQLRLVHNSLDNHFPELIESPSGLIPSLFNFFWSFDDKKSDETCKLLENYLDMATSLCGTKVILSVLFEDNLLSEFEENNQDFEYKGYENLLKNTLNELDQLTKCRESVKTMLEMKTIYENEDKIVAAVSVALAELYNFQLQPFLQLREISYNHILNFKAQIENPDLGLRIKNEANKEIAECTDQYLSANGALQHLYQEYYRKNVDLVYGQLQRMLEDKEKFGRSAFDVGGGLDRLQKLDVQFSHERLKLLNAIKLTKEYQRGQLKQALESESINSNDFQVLQHDLKEADISLLDSKLDILAEKEALLKKKLTIIEKLNDSNNCEIFFDALEEVDDNSNFKNVTRKSNSIAAENIRARLRTLYRKRANIRNKRSFQLANRKLILNSSNLTSNRDKNSHQVDREAKVKVKFLEDKKKLEAFKECRLQTLQRLKMFKEKKEKALTESEDNIDASIITLPNYPKLDQKSYLDSDLHFPSPPSLETLNFFEVPKSIRPLILNQSSPFLSTSSGLSTLSTSPPQPTIACPPPPTLVQPAFTTSPSPPQPPPPPPPPPSFYSNDLLNKTNFVTKIEMKKNQLKPVITKCSDHRSAINLSEILTVRNNLKKINEKIPIRKQMEASDFQNSLLSVLAKIRNANSDSEASDDDDSFE